MGSGTYLRDESVNITSDCHHHHRQCCRFCAEKGKQRLDIQERDTNEYLNCTAAKNVHIVLIVVVLQAAEPGHSKNGTSGGSP